MRPSSRTPQRTTCAALQAARSQPNRTIMVAILCTSTILTVRDLFKFVRNRYGTTAVLWIRRATGYSSGERCNHMVIVHAKAEPLLQGQPTQDASSDGPDFVGLRKDYSRRCSAKGHSYISALPTHIINKPYSKYMPITI